MKEPMDLDRARHAVKFLSEHLVDEGLVPSHLQADLSAYAPDGAVSLILNGNGRSVRIVILTQHEVQNGFTFENFERRCQLAIEVYAQSGPPLAPDPEKLVGWTWHPADGWQKVPEEHQRGAIEAVVSPAGTAVSWQRKPHALRVDHIGQRSQIVCSCGWCGEIEVDSGISYCNFRQASAAFDHESGLTRVAPFPSRLLPLPENPLANPTGETWTKVTADGVTHGTSLGAVLGEAVARDAARDERDYAQARLMRDEALNKLGFRPDSEHLPSCALSLAERLESARKTARGADENFRRALQAAESKTLLAAFRELADQRWRELDALESEAQGRDLTKCDCAFGSSSDPRLDESPIAAWIAEISQ